VKIGENPAHEFENFPPQADGVKVDFKVDLQPAYEYLEKHGGSDMGWWEKMKEILESAAHFFNALAPVADEGMQIAGAISNDPKVKAAAAITHASVPVALHALDALQRAADGDTHVSIPIDAVRNLAEVISSHGAAHSTAR